MFQIVRCGILAASANYIHPSNGKFSSYCFFYVRKEMIKYFHELNIISFTLTKLKDSELEEKKKIAKNTEYIDFSKYQIADDIQEKLERLENSLNGTQDALKFFNPLNEIDKLVMFHYYGAYDHEKMNIKEISKVTGKSPEWVSCRRNRLIRRIRKSNTPHE